MMVKVTVRPVVFIKVMEKTALRVTVSEIRYFTVTT